MTAAQYIDIAAAIAAAIAEIQRLAQGEIAPPASIYDVRRRNAPGVAWLKKHGYPYHTLVAQSGLSPNSRSVRSQRTANPAGVPAAVEAEIVAAFAAGDHEPMHHREWPLTAIPTRTETHIAIDHRTGDTIKVTRYYASIR